MRVTRALLFSKRACTSQVEKFVKLFPDGVDVTEATCIAFANEFNWSWAARHLLPATLYEEYHAKRAALYEEHQAKRAPLYEEYDAKRAALYAEYDAKRAALDEEYDA